jgi:cytochrome c553
MTKTNAALCAITMALSSLWTGQSLAQGAAKGDPKGDPDAARKGKISMCIGCHGIPMYHTAYPEVYLVPKIAGQSPEYIVRALQAYRSGERSHPSMQGIAKSLSDQDMADLAAYYGGEAKQAGASK